MNIVKVFKYVATRFETYFYWIIVGMGEGCLYGLLDSLSHRRALPKPERYRQSIAEMAGNGRWLSRLPSVHACGLEAPPLVTFLLSCHVGRKLTRSRWTRVGHSTLKMMLKGEKAGAMCSLSKLCKRKRLSWGRMIEILDMHGRFPALQGVHKLNVWRETRVIAGFWLAEHG